MLYCIRRAANTVAPPVVDRTAVNGSIRYLIADQIIQFL